MLNWTCAETAAKLAPAAVLAGALAISVDAASALTADEVLSNMDPVEANSFIAGTVEGLATARWLADRPDPSGMQCIYDWYLGDPAETFEQTMAWLERHPDQQVGILLHVLIERECPSG